MAVVDTYLTNTLLIPDDDYSSWLQLHSAPQHSAPREPVHVVPAWNPWGAPTALGRNVTERESLEVAVLRRGGMFTVGAVVAADHTWAEQALVVRGLDDVGTARLAAEHGHEIFWRWDAEGLHVLEWGWGAVLGTTGVIARPVVHRPCPVRGPADDGRPCRRQHAKLAGESETAFDRRRTTLICTAGCDTCDSGRLIEPAVDDHIRAMWAVPSRHR